MAPSISVIAPVYNEVENVAALVAAIRGALDGERWPYEIVLVDDGSTDGTRELLRTLAAENPMLRVLFFRRNFGQTAAMDAGFAAARGDVVIPIDADLQNDPIDIPALMAKLDEGFDVVAGWRKDRQDASARVLPSRIANWMIARYGRVRIHDTGCTLKAFRRPIAEQLRLYGDMHRFLPIYATLAGARIAEVPVKHHPRRAGKSKYGFSRILKIIPDLMLAVYLRGFNRKPIQLYGGLGVGAILLGILAAALGLAATVLTGFSALAVGLWLAAIMSVFAGAILCLLGLQAEVLMRTYYESQGRRPYLVAEEFGGSAVARDRESVTA